MDFIHIRAFTQNKSDADPADSAAPINQNLSFACHPARRAKPHHRPEQGDRMPVISPGISTLLDLP
jgi:hypothetical protein